MGAYHEMDLPIISYEVACQRYPDINGHPATHTQLALHIQGGTTTEHGKTVEQVQITFGKPPASGGRQIGYVQESGNQATVIVTIPAAEFETYLVILHDNPKAHVYCGIDVGATTVGYFNLATQGFLPAKS